MIYHLRQVFTYQRLISIVAVMSICLTHFFLAYAPVYIGNNVSFSYRNILLTSTHDYNDFNIVITKPIIIKDNVWITTNVTILPGVTIGENTIIGAGSVVTRDIPANVYAAGNPCRVIKKRYGI